MSDKLSIAYAQISGQILLTGRSQFTTGMKWIHVGQKRVDNVHSSVLHHSVRVTYSCYVPVVLLRPFVVKVLQYRPRSTR